MNDTNQHPSQETFARATCSENGGLVTNAAKPPDLLPCPHCGGNMKLTRSLRDRGPGSKFIRWAAWPADALASCGACQAALEWTERPFARQATAAWNQRAGISALPENTRELLLKLHDEFYGGPKAHADAFRILTDVVETLEVLGAINPKAPRSQNGCKLNDGPAETM